MSAVSTRLAGLLAAAVLVAACTTGGASSSADGSASDPPASSPAPSGSIPELLDGPVAPGRYVILPPDVGWAECAAWVPECPPEPPQARSLRLEITLPSGWEAGFDQTVIHPSQGTTEGPSGAGFVIGWTVPTAGLHSDPCQQVPHLAPDIRVGPTVDEFIDAVVAHPSIEVSEPVDVELGGFLGRFFQLTAPPDISACRDWRPFEPGIYAQGPDNLWSVWVIDIEGFRMILLTQEFPGTPAKDSAALRSIVESIEFRP